MGYVSQDVRDLVIIELAHGWHDRIVGLTVHGHGSRQAVECNGDRPLGRGCQQIRPSQWWKDTLESLSVRLMAYGTGAVEMRLSGFDLLIESQSTLLRGGRDLTDDFETLRLVTQINRVHLLTRIHESILWTAHFEDCEGAFVEGPENRVIHHHKAAGHHGVKLGDRGAAGRNEGGLNVLLKACAAFEPYLVKNLANDVERRHQVGAAIADEQPYLIADQNYQRVVPDQRPLAAVEYNVGWSFVDRLLHIEGLQPFLAILPDRVELTLHHVILMVYGLEPLGWLHQHQAIHSIADVHAHWRGRTVVDVDTLVNRFEGELGLMSRRCEARRCAAAGTHYTVQIDVVRHLVVRMVLQMELLRMTLPHADETAGHGSPKGPECVTNALGNFPFHLPNFQLDDDFGRLRAMRWRRNIGRRCQNRMDRRTHTGN